MVHKFQSVGKSPRINCLTNSNTCFGCGKMDNNVRNFPSVAKNEGDNHLWSQPYPSSGSMVVRNRIGLMHLGSTRS